jgi:hypothetical protein
LASLVQGFCLASIENGYFPTVKLNLLKHSYRTSARALRTTPSQAKVKMLRVKPGNLGSDIRFGKIIANRHPSHRKLPRPEGQVNLIYFGFFDLAAFLPDELGVK